MPTFVTGLRLWDDQCIVKEEKEKLSCYLTAPSPLVAFWIYGGGGEDSFLTVTLSIQGLVETDWSDK